MKKFIFVFIFLLSYGFALSQAQIQWINRFGGSQWDIPSTVKADVKGNVYVTGTFGVTSQTNPVLIKYNLSGDSLWSRKFFPPDSANSGGSAMLLEDTSYIYISGRYILKYNTQGDLLYSKFYGCSTNEMSFDMGNNVVYAGKDQLTSQKLCLLKCNKNGDSLWRRTYPYPGSSIAEVVGIAVDKSNNIYVLGQSFELATDYDYMTMKFDTNGNMIWYRKHDGLEPQAYDEPTSIAVDSSDNVIVTGTSANSNGASNFLTIKYDSSGTIVWQQRHPSSGSGSEDMKLDKFNNIYICGIHNVGGYATLKYSSSGELMWYHAVSGTAFPPDNSLTLDSAGNVYMACNLRNSQGFSGYQVLKYNNTGSLLWNVVYPTSGIRSYYSTAIDVDKWGNVFVTGEGQASSTYDFVTIRINQTTGVNNNGNGIVKNFTLEQNYPNPFNPSTIINYQLTINSPPRRIILNVYDVNGKLLKELVNEKQTAGSYSLVFDGSGLPSGTYVYRLQAGDFSETKKMVLLK